MVKSQRKRQAPCEDGLEWVQGFLTGLITWVKTVEGKLLPFLAVPLGFFQACVSDH